MTSDLHFCFVVTGSHLQSAEAVIASLHKHNQVVRATILLVDGISSETKTRLNTSQIRILAPEDLGIQDLEHIRAFYNCFELCNALRPWLIYHLLFTTGATKVVYLDADLFVTGSFDRLSAILDEKSFAFIPHVTAGLPLDGLKPDDLDFLRAGELNSGFWAFRASSNSERALRWLRERICLYGFDAPDEGMFVDQRLLASVVLLFLGDFYLITDPGYNVAYWNLQDRPLEWQDGCCYANGHPLVFFHFSGFDPAEPTMLSRHGTRYRRCEEVPGLPRLVDEYMRLLAAQSNQPEAGIPQVRALPLAEPTPLMRRYYFRHRAFPRHRAWFRFLEWVAVTGRNFFQSLTNRLID